MNKKVFSLLGTLLFLALLCKPVGAIDVMSWSPRTPAGGGYIADPNFYFKMGTVVEYGSQSLLFNEYTVTAVVEEETAIFESHQTGLGYFESDNDEGRTVYFNKKGKPMDGFGVVLQIDKESDDVQYFSPHTTVKTTTTTNTYNLLP